jgi:aminoglycoside phosphotransferase (APT) family kinase protein
MFSKVRSLIPYNVLMTRRGSVVIDWSNSSIGNPLADVALATPILSGVQVLEPQHCSVLNQFEKAYLARHLQLRPADRQQLAAWQPIVAVVRLNENIPGLQEW